MVRQVPIIVLLAAALSGTALSIFLKDVSKSHGSYSRRHNKGDDDNQRKQRYGYASGRGAPSQPPTPPPTTEETASPPNTGAIVGGVVGGLVFFALLTGLGILYYRRRRSHLAPSTAHRAASDRRGWLQINDPTDDSHVVFCPDLKHNNTAQYNNGRADTDVEVALQRKAEILDDLRFEAAVRDGVKA